MLTEVFLISLLVSGTLEHQVCNNKVKKIKTVDISNGTHLSDGAVYFGGERYDRTEYFVDKNGVERGCVCLKKKCMRKCCPVGYGYSHDKKKCVNMTVDFNPPLWDDYEQLTEKKATETFHIIAGRLACKPDQARVRVGQATEILHLRMDGQLYVNVQNGSYSWTIHGLDSYCIDTFVTEGPDGQNTAKLDALICFDDKQDNHHYLLSSTCMIISCVFLLATLAVYAWLPELRNLHGKVLMVYLACLLVGFSFFSAMQLMLHFDNIQPFTCFGFTIVIYFFLESAFFWLNVMSFDIWWTFSGNRGPSSKSRTRFLAYAAYAFGIPTALTVLLISLEFAGLPRYPWLPGLRGGGCFIHGTSKLIYFYGPILILCIANMTFFILTALKITQIQKQTSVLKSKESSTHDRHRNDKQRLLLYLKLFTVMGVNWILEVVSAVYPDMADFWKFTDAYNVLIGLIIFIIFVCKRKIFRLIKKRLELETEPSPNPSRDSTKASRPYLKYEQLRGVPMSRTQTTTSRTMSCREDVQMGSIKNKPANI